MDRPVPKLEVDLTRPEAFPPAAVLRAAIAQTLAP